MNPKSNPNEQQQSCDDKSPNQDLLDSKLRKWTNLIPEVTIAYIKDSRNPPNLRFYALAYLLHGVFLVILLKLGAHDTHYWMVFTAFVIVVLILKDRQWPSQNTD